MTLSGAVQQNKCWSQSVISKLNYLGKWARGVQAVLGNAMHVIAS